MREGLNTLTGPMGVVVGETISMRRHLSLMQIKQDEIERQKDLIDFLQSERELGVAETFCGVPMSEAMQIVLASKAPKDV